MAASSLVFAGVCLSQSACARNLRIKIVFAYTCGRAKTISIRSVWAQIFFKYGEKNIRFRKYPDTFGGV